MQIRLAEVTKAPRQHALPETSLLFESGRATLGLAETERRPTVLGLLATGRMRPDGGEVLLDGAHDPAGLRHRVALVDAPDVSAPEPNVLVRSVVQEELMFAGRRAGLRHAREWLIEQRLAEVIHRPVSNLDPEPRLRLLCELAVLRPHVEGFALVSPDRHGGDPRAWWALAEEFAERGYAVLVIAGQASRIVLAPSLAPSDEPAPELDPNAAEES